MKITYSTTCWDTYKPMPKKKSSMKRTLYRTFLSALAFVTGVLTMPLAAILWPFAAAWLMWWESEEVDAEEGND